MRLVVTVSVVFVCIGLPGRAQTLQGTVLDEGGDPVISGNVVVYSGTDVIAGGQTEFDGRYRFSLDPGCYTVKASNFGYTPLWISCVIITEGKTVTLDLNFVDEGRPVREGCSWVYINPPYDVAELTSGTTFRRDFIAQTFGAQPPNTAKSGYRWSARKRRAYRRNLRRRNEQCSCP